MNVSAHPGSPGNQRVQRGSGGGVLSTPAPQREFCGDEWYEQFMEDDTTQQARVPSQNECMIKKSKKLQKCRCKLDDDCFVCCESGKCWTLCNCSIARAQRQVFHMQSSHERVKERRYQRSFYQSGPYISINWESEEQRLLNKFLHVCDFAALFTALGNVENRKGAFSVIWLYIRGSIGRITQEIQDTITSTLQMAFDTIFSRDNSLPEFQAEEGFAWYVNQLHTRWKSFSTSPFCDKFKKLVVCIVGIIMCFQNKIGKSVRNFIGKLCGKRLEIPLGVDLMDTTLECVAYVIKFFQSWKEDTYLDEFTSPDIKEAEQKFVRVSSAVDAIEANQFDQTTYADHAELYADIDDLKESFTKFHKQSSGNLSSYYLQKCKEVHKLWFKVRPPSNLGTLREAAFGVLVHGNTGVGKSSATLQIGTFLLGVNGFSGGEKYTVNLNTDDKFHSEYKPHHNLVILDDVANANPKLASTVNHTQTIIDFINNAPKTALKAEMEQKGCIPICPKVVIGTTNVRDVNAAHFSAFPSSILRRFDIIMDVVVKPEYTKDGTHFLDQTKVPDEEIVDVWKYVIYKIQAFENGECKLLPDRTIETFAELCEYMTILSQRHFNSQNNLVKRLKRTMGLKVCEHNLFRVKCPTCSAEQGREKSEEPNVWPGDLEEKEEDVQNLRESKEDESVRGKQAVDRAVPPVEGEKDDITVSQRLEDTNDYLMQKLRHSLPVHYGPVRTTPEEKYRSCKGRLDPVSQELLEKSPGKLELNQEDHRDVEEKCDAEIVAKQMKEIDQIDGVSFKKFKSVDEWWTYTSRALQEDKVDFKTLMRSWGNVFSKTEIDPEEERTLPPPPTLVRQKAKRWSLREAEQLRSQANKSSLNPSAPPFIPMSRVQEDEEEESKLNPEAKVFVPSKFQSNFVVDGYNTVCSTFEAIRCFDSIMNVLWNMTFGVWFIGPYMHRLCCNQRVDAVSMPLVFISFKFPLFTLFLLYYLFCYSVNHLFLRRYRTLRSYADFMCRKDTIFFMGLSLGVITAIQAYRRSSFSSFQSLSEGSPPSTTYEPRENVWKKPAITPLMTTHESATTTFKDFCVKLSKSCSFVTLYDGHTRIHTNMFPIKGDIWVCNSHTLRRLKGQTISGNLIRGTSEENGNSRNFVINMSQTYSISDQDITFLKIPSLGSQPNNYRFLLDFRGTRGVKSLRGKVVCRMKEGDLRDFVAVNINRSQTETTDERGACLRFENIYSMKLSEETFVGLCGSPVLATGSGSVLLGIHFSGLGERAFCAPITMEDVDRAVEFFSTTSNSTFVFHSAGEISTRVLGMEFGPFSEPHFKSPTRFLDDGAEAVFYGRANVERRTFRSNVVKSEISDDVERYLGIVKEHDKPSQMNHYRHFQRHMSICTSIDNEIDQYLLGRAQEDLHRKFVRNCFLYKDELIDSVHPLDWESVASGSVGVWGFDRMPQSTSAGFPVNCPKDKYFDDVGNDRIIPGAELMEEIRTMERIYLSGERCNAIFRANLKDEPTKISKTKVRVFAGAPLALSCMVRKYFLTQAVFIMNHPLSFECAVGINAYSGEWNQLMTHVRRFGTDRGIAGDFSDYDARTAVDFLIRAYTELIGIAETCNKIRMGQKLEPAFSDDDMIVMRGLATDLCQALYEYNGDIVGYVGTNPSGHNLTVIVNNLVNSLYLRYAYYSTCEEGGIEPEDFDQNVSLICYGDDNIMSVNPKCHFYTHEAIKRSLSDISVLYTRADKSNEPIDFNDLNNEEFLKRHCRFDDEIGEFVAPLLIKSIGKSLHCRDSRSPISPTEHAVAVISGAVREFFLHGRSEYDLRISQLRDLVKNNSHLPLTEADLPDYDILLNDYLTEKSQLSGVPRTLS